MKYFDRNAAVRAVQGLAEENASLQADMQSAIGIAFRFGERIKALRVALGDEVVFAGLAPADVEGSVGEGIKPPGLNPGDPEGSAGSNPAASAIADVADLAADLVGLWENQKIIGLPRSDMLVHYAEGGAGDISAACREAAEVIIGIRSANGKLKAEIDRLRATEARLREDYEATYKVLQASISLGARLRAALETTRAHLQGKPVLDAYVMIKGEADPRNFPTLGQMIDRALEQKTE